MVQKKKINIAMLQMSSVIGDVQANIDKVENLVREYLPSETDVLVLPEVWTVGWACTHFRETAQNVESGSVHDFLSSSHP